MDNNMRLQILIVIIIAIVIMAFFMKYKEGYNPIDMAWTRAVWAKQKQQRENLTPHSLDWGKMSQRKTRNQLQQSLRI